MKSILLIVCCLNLISIQLLAKTTKNESEVFGVLVQIENEKVLTSESFSKIKLEFELSEKKYFPAIKVISLRSVNKKINKSSLENFCKKIKTVMGVIHCELNFKYTIDDTSEPCIDCRKDKIAIPIKTITDKIECKMVPDKPITHQKKGLSTFWAQEYTGADLLRARLNAIPALNITDNLFEVWDSGEQNKHAEHVSNLIEGPHASALIPNHKTRDYKELTTFEFGVDQYQKYYEKCTKVENCPYYINNSMSWKDSEITSQIVEKIVDQGSLFITSAGNDSLPVEKLKQQLMDKNKLIVVGSLTPSGTASDFSNVSSELTISAPSDYYITSYNFKGEVNTFSGTSGAAPQVTAALATFTLISGYKLNTFEAKELLKKTAINFPDYPAPNSLGPGILNSYKIGEIAFQLQKECGKANLTCIKKRLTSDNLYNFSLETKGLEKEAKELFPGCFTKKNGPSENMSCEQKRVLFNQIRKASFLNPKNKELWQLIACISKEDGYFKNQEFYQKLAHRTNKNEKQLFNSLIQNKRDIEIIQTLLSDPRYSSDSLVEKFLVKPSNHIAIISYVLANPKFAQNPKISKWIKKVIENGTQESDAHLISFVLKNKNSIENPGWGSWVDKLVQKNSADNFIASELLSNPEVVNHPKFNQWVETLLKRSINEKKSKCSSDTDYNCEHSPRHLLKYLFSKEHLIRHPLYDRWIDIAVKRCDPTIEDLNSFSLQIIMGISENNPRHQMWLNMVGTKIDSILKKGDYPIGRIETDINSFPLWKNYYLNKFREKGIIGEITDSNIEKYLNTLN